MSHPLADSMYDHDQVQSQSREPLLRKVMFLRNGSPNWVGIKFPKRNNAVWIHQSDFDKLVDEIIGGLQL